MLKLAASSTIFEAGERVPSWLFDFDRTKAVITFAARCSVAEEQDGSFTIYLLGRGPEMIHVRGLTNDRISVSGCGTGVMMYGPLPNP